MPPTANKRKTGDPAANLPKPFSPQALEDFYEGYTFKSFGDFLGASNTARAAGRKLHSFQLLLRAGALTPEVYAVYEKE